MKFVTNHADRSSLYGFKHCESLITFSRLGLVQVLSHRDGYFGGFFKIQHPKMALLAEMDKISCDFHNWFEDSEDLSYDQVQAQGEKVDKQLKALARQVPADLLAQLKDLLKVKRTAAEAGYSFHLPCDE